MLDLVRNNPAMPVHWGKNQPGMQAKEELDEVQKAAVKSLWIVAAEHSASIANTMSQAGLHKQVTNRILEPYQMIKVVLTSTQFNNFYWLRDHPDAQPEIAELAKRMYLVHSEASPSYLEANEWHVPYVETARDRHDILRYYDENANEIPLEQALKLSASLCAQVSYRKNNQDLEKANEIFQKLIESEPCHASPTEHQATPMNYPQGSNAKIDYMLTTDGVTHIDKIGILFSANFHDWIQHRQLIKNNAKYY
jgi:phage gp37-like protein